MKNLVVAGGGVLGSQIGFQAAYKGKDVTFWLRSEASIERAKAKIENLYKVYLAELNYSKSEIGKEKANHAAGLIEDVESLSAEKIDELIENVKSAFENIKYETDIEKAVKDADFIIESVAEIEAEKHEFFKAISSYIPQKTIVSSNSSTMMPSTFAQDTGRPEKYLHFHFANRIWRSNIAEIMLHEGTDPQVKDTVFEFAKEIGMVPVVVNKEQPGYILNSLLIPFLNSAQYLLANDIASHEDIDKTWKIGTGSPRGPFEILDVIGMVTPYNLAMSKPGADDPSTVNGKIAAMLKKMIDEGKTGLAAGEGFYKYDKNGNKI